MLKLGGIDPEKLYQATLNGCFYQQLHSLIISFCLNAVSPITPESMLFVAKERLQGLKYNIDIKRRGGGRQVRGEGIDMSTLIVDSI